jgi:hypothetical protein
MDDPVSLKNEIAERLAALDSASQEDIKKLMILAKRMDRHSLDANTSQYLAAADIMGRFGITEHCWSSVSNFVKKAVYAKKIGMPFEKFISITAVYPVLLNKSVEGLEERRRSLGMAKDEFGRLIIKFPNVINAGIGKFRDARIHLGLGIDDYRKLMTKFPRLISYSNERFDDIKRYFNLNDNEFRRLLHRFPQIVSFGIAKLEDKRAYLGLDTEEFRTVVLKAPQIIGLSFKNLEEKREYLNISKEEFRNLILGLPTIIFFSRENMDQKFRFYESRIGIRREEIIGYTCSKGAKQKDASADHQVRFSRVCMSYALHGRVMPRYVTYRHMLRKKGMDFNPDKFLGIVKRNESDFISQIDHRLRDKSLESDAKVESLKPYYERAKHLCELMRKRGSTTLRSVQAN